MTATNSETPYGINNVLQVAVAVTDQLQSLGLQFCIIGGVAYQRWGEPRQTVDVDATIFGEFGYEEGLTTELLRRFPSRIENPLEFALENRILLLLSPEGTGIDLSLGGLPFEERMIERSSDWIVPQHGTIRTCSAEDLVVLKAFAARPQDWIDIEKTIIRQGTPLNRALIRDELKPLASLKEEPEILDQLENLFQEHPAK